MNTFNVGESVEVRVSESWHQAEYRRPFGSYHRVYLTGPGGGFEWDAAPSEIRTRPNASAPGYGPAPMPVATVPPFMSTDSAVRKKMPVFTGVVAYFPDAQLCKAFLSVVGNDKHSPGEPLHWAKHKSTDEPDAGMRHAIDSLPGRGVPPDVGLEALAHLAHLTAKAWRADAELQRACDEVRAAVAAGKEWRK